ncbi:MAG: stage II sporulation protein M, partial [Deltaproteobacteria bacterium]|nr:stage II sporulation protein M [Deltaproteobacteria bacterium]
MILDLRKFIKEEQPYWDELEGILDELEKGTGRRLDLAGLKRFHYLYQRSSADLAKLTTFSSEPNMRRYVESLVARAYGEIHETREKPHRLVPLYWFFTSFPRTFRKHIRAFGVSFLAMFIGFVLGGFAILIDPDAKESLIGFSHLKGDPSERVAKEEDTDKDRLQGRKTSFSSFLMTHNTKVSIFTLALGMTYGIGTIIMLFYNGVILGVIALDYMVAGEAWFLFGWLLPHGSIEIPAILVAG